jgi:hypothetical protein
VSRVTIVWTGFLGAHDAHAWRDEGGWRFDGPVGCAPGHARREPRGPYWRGPVSGQFVAALVRAAERRGFEVARS